MPYYPDFSKLQITRDDDIDRKLQEWKEKRQKQNYQHALEEEARRKAEVKLNEQKATQLPALQYSPPTGLEWRAGRETFGEKVGRLVPSLFYGFGQNMGFLPVFEHIMRRSEQRAIEEGRMAPQYAQWQEPALLGDYAPVARGTPDELLAQAAGGIIGTLIPIFGTEAVVGGLVGKGLTRFAPRLLNSPSFAARLTEASLRGTAVGTVYGAGMAALQGEPPEKIATEAAGSGALFGIGAVAGKMAEAAFRRIAALEAERRLRELFKGIRRVKP